jgi:hypothetical protein
MKVYRVGNHWGITIVEADRDAPVDPATGRTKTDRLIGMTRTPEDAERIVTALNHAVERGLI